MTRTNLQELFAGAVSMTQSVFCDDKNSDSMGFVPRGKSKEVDPKLVEAERQLHEAFTRYLNERMGAFKNSAQFGGKAGISRPELTAIKDGSRLVTEGQLLKIVVRLGPSLAEVLSRLALIASDVAHGIPRTAVRVQEAEPDMATLVTGTGRKVAVAPAKSEAAKASIEAAANEKSKKRPRKRSERSSERAPSFPSTRQRPPSQDS